MDWIARLNAALDFYTSVVDLVHGRIAKAKGAIEINRALHDVLAGIWMKVQDGQLHAEFQLRVIADDLSMPNGLAQVLSQDLAGRRMSLPTGSYAGNPDPVSLTKTALDPNSTVGEGKVSQPMRVSSARISSEDRSSL